VVMIDNKLTEHYDLARTTVGLYRASPTVWNSLPDELRNSDSFVGFKQFLKTIFFSSVTSVTSALEVFYGDALYKSTFYLLTYLSRELDGTNVSFMQEQYVGEHVKDLT